MKEYYECHITMEPGEKTRNYVQHAVESLNWKFSAIDGDPDLGVGVKCYATRQFNTRLDKEDVVIWLNDIAKALHSQGLTILRRKIELVIYDNREEL